MGWFGSAVAFAPGAIFDAPPSAGSHPIDFRKRRHSRAERPSHGLIGVRGPACGWHPIATQSKCPRSLLHLSQEAGNGRTVRPITSKRIRYCLVLPIYRPGKVHILPCTRLQTLEPDWNSPSSGRHSPHEGQQKRPRKDAKAHSRNITGRTQRPRRQIF